MKQIYKTAIVREEVAARPYQELYKKMLLDPAKKKDWAAQEQQVLKPLMAIQARINVYNAYTFICNHCNY